jgi:hypothetical protein
VQEAATQFAQLLDDRVRVLGPDHPDTLLTRNNLAHWTEVLRAPPRQLIVGLTSKSSLGYRRDPSMASADVSSAIDTGIRVLGRLRVSWVATARTHSPCGTAGPARLREGPRL